MQMTDRSRESHLNFAKVGEIEGGDGCEVGANEHDLGMAMLTLRLAGELPALGHEQIKFITDRVLSHDQSPTFGVWLWADTRAAGHAYLEHEADRLVKTHHTLYLRGRVQIEAMIPTNRPDGERVLAIWLATSEMPREYMSRLFGLGQCEEFWCRPGTVPPWADGSDWKMGSLDD
jgi:hypothetical protein